MAIGSIRRSLAALVALTTLLILKTAGVTAKNPKHVIFLVIDDFGFADASYKSSMYNGTAPPPTPHIDALATAGIRLESHYVNKLCSPTRTALLSGRYAYTNGMDDGVIVDGQDIDMPLNLQTIGDRLKRGGWKTSAFGKWDAGMTTWGSTPPCRGFEHFEGFYSAASDYYTHMVGPGFDYHCDARVDVNASKVYTTHKVTRDVQAWITSRVEEHRAQAGQGGTGEDDALRTFAYVAHEAVHGPLEVPYEYVTGACEALVPADRPIRRIYCGMVRALDESILNISSTYKSLGIWEDTLLIGIADNGGIPYVGGNNYPLRGTKASVFEGGVRGFAFISGAGIESSLRGTVSHEILHVVDWLPTLVGGVAGLDLSDNTTGRPCPTCKRPVAPLDGFNQWPMFSTPGQSSVREEVLLDLQTTAQNPRARQAGTTRIPGSGAIRVGRWKLMHGHQSVFPGNCTLRGGKSQTSRSPPIPIPPADMAPWCPFGWTPPPRADGHYQPPQPPPELPCKNKLPCNLEADSGYIAGQTLLFDVVNDMYERHNLAAQHPDIVKRLLARLQRYNNTHCGGERCLPDNAGGRLGRPVGKSGPGGVPVWLPWRGNPDPSKCDTNRTAPAE